MNSNIKSVCNRIQSVDGVLVKLLAKQDSLIDTKAELLCQIEDVSGYLDIAEDVTEFLEALQLESQKAEKGLYEELLTECVKDVVPSFDGKILLKTGVTSGRPELEILCESNGVIENVNLDRGGSINNVLAIGLRILCLTKTRNRPFLMFDESDCWLKSEYIPNLASVISSLASKVGIQVLYISHHSPEMFHGCAKVIELTKQNGEIITDVVSEREKALSEYEGENPELLSGVGLRYLRLLNYRGHKNTLIELDPCVTVLCGSMDIGKSKCLEAIASVARNESREKIIRDGAPKCQVEIGLEDGLALMWSYSRSGSKKTEYRLVDSNGEALEVSTEGKVVPEWVNQYLALDYVKGVDVNYSNQFNPNFILDRSVSKHKRAEIFTISTEERKIQSMLNAHARKTKSYKTELNVYKGQLKTVKTKLNALSPISVAYQHAENARSAVTGLENKQNSSKRILEIDKRFDELVTVGQAAKKLESFSSINEPLDIEANLKKAKKLECVIEKLSDVRPHLGIKTPEVVNGPIRFEDGVAKAKRILDIGVGLSQSKQVLEKVDRVPESIPELSENLVVKAVSLHKLLSQFDEVTENGASCSAQLKKLEQELEENSKLIEELVQKIGKNCPLCGGGVHHKHSVDNQKEVCDA